MKRRVIVCFAVIALMAAAFPTLGLAGDEMRLAVGETSGFFWVMGKEFSRIWNNVGIPTKTMESSGDRESLQMLLDKKADIALVSGFALKDFLDEHPGSPIVTTASLWKLPVHFLLRDTFVKTNSAHDLSGRKLYLGPEGSPDEALSRRILAAFDVKPSSFTEKVPEAGLLSAMADFKWQPLDGAILYGPTPAPLVSEIIDRTGNTMRLIPASPADIATLVAAGLPIFSVTIPKDTYLFQGEDIVLAATGTYLVSLSSLPGDTVKRLSGIVFENAPAIHRYFPQGEQLKIEDAAAHLIAPLHPALTR